MLVHNTASSLSHSRQFAAFPKQRCPLQSSSSRSLTFLTSVLSSRFSSSTCSLDLRNWMGQRHSPPGRSELRLAWITIPPCFCTSCRLDTNQAYTTSSSTTSPSTANQEQNAVITTKDDWHPSLYYHLFEDSELCDTGSDSKMSRKVRRCLTGALSYCIWQFGLGFGKTW